MRIKATKSEMEQTGVYSIVHVASGKRYVGSAAQSFRARMNGHLSALRKGRHHSIRLQRSWNKYGEDAFEWRIDECTRPEFAVACEQVFIDFRKSSDPTLGFNIYPTAGSPRGNKQSDDTKEKIRAKATGRLVSDATRARMSASSMNPPQITRDRLSAAGKGRQHTAEAKAKIAESNRRRGPRSAATRAKIGEGHRGRKASEEAKARMSVSRTGRRHTAEAIANMRIAQAGRVCLESTRAKLSKINTGRKASPDAKTRMSESQRLRWKKRKLYAAVKKKLMIQRTLFDVE